MNQQLELSLVENITRTCNEARALAEDAANKGRDAVLKARECGQFLIEAKTSVGHGRWMAWFNANLNHGFNFTIQTAAKWMKLAETPIEELDRALSLRQAYIAAGILPEPHRDGKQSGNADGQQWLSSILKTWETISHTLEKRPIGQWPEIQRLTLKEKLKPMAELYATL